VCTCVYMCVHVYVSVCECVPVSVWRGRGWEGKGGGDVYDYDVRLGAYKFLLLLHSFYSFFSFFCQVLVETFQSVLQSANQDHLRTFYVLGTYAQYSIAQFVYIIKFQEALFNFLVSHQTYDLCCIVLNVDELFSLHEIFSSLYSSSSVYFVD
jgi:hypothetical protein